MAASIDTRRIHEINNSEKCGRLPMVIGNTNSKHVSLRASRPRKRKQTHTPRPEQDIEESEFIEFIDIAPFDNQCQTSPRQAVLQSQAESDIESESETEEHLDLSQSSVSNSSGACAKVHDSSGEETSDSCVIIERSESGYSDNSASVSDNLSASPNQYLVPLTNVLVDVGAEVSYQLTHVETRQKSTAQLTGDGLHTVKSKLDRLSNGVKQEMAEDDLNPEDVAASWPRALPLAALSSMTSNSIPKTKTKLRKRNCNYKIFFYLYVTCKKIKHSHRYLYLEHRNIVIYCQFVSG